MTADCVTLWIGDRLGPVERACLRSVARQGHGIALYCYGEPDGVPREAELRDAAAILPESKVFRHRNGSVALFSDWFRYELLRRGLGTWIDTDMYLLAPLDGRRPYLFGEESPGCINNAVLRLPADSPLLAGLLAIFETGAIPRWLPWPSYVRTWLRRLVMPGNPASHLPWGSTGPLALTALARRFGLDRQALASETFNPVHWRDAGWIIDPAVGLEQVIGAQTVGVHLWNECIKGIKEQRPPAGSFLERLHREGS